MFFPRLLVGSLLTVALSSMVSAHHDSEPATGADAMLQHIEADDHVTMELVMPHRHANGNQLLINFFDAAEGVSIQPEAVTVVFSQSGQEDSSSEPITLESNGPVYSAPASGITEPGEWAMRFSVQVDAQTQSEFTVTTELF